MTQLHPQAAITGSAVGASQQAADSQYTGPCNIIVADLHVVLKTDATGWQ